MELLLVEPYYSGSHQQWCDGLRAHSSHRVNLLSLRGKYWKWRMTGGAVALAEEAQKQHKPDVILATDMLDLAVFKALYPASHSIPVVLYFHENQLMYPWDTADGHDEERDRHYAFTNYTSALAADEVWFSSTFQMEGFLQSLDMFLRAFPDNRGLHNVNSIRDRSFVIPVGIGPFPEISRSRENNIILWNHRHEHDKNPEQFFEVLSLLSKEGSDFDLVVLGESYQRSPEVFSRAKESLEKHIIHWGYAGREEYFNWLNKATIAPVTSGHDFFGISVLESAAMGVVPILPERLVYPEHFGKTNAPFYNTTQELTEQLRNLLSQPWSLRQDIVDAARQYDWPEVIKRYDTRLENLISQNKMFPGS